MTDKLSSKVTTISQLEVINNIIDDMSTTTSYTAECPDLTASNGVITWNITHNLGTRNVICSLYHGTEEVTNKGVVITSNNDVTITFNDTNVSAGDYKVVIIASGSTISVSDNDGQWVTKESALAVELSGTSEVLYDLSDYLPKDNYSYDVILYGQIWVTGTVGNYRNLIVGTSIIPWCAPCAARQVSSNNGSVVSAGTILIPVGTDRKLKLLSRPNDTANSKYSLYLFGYRRIGNNIEKVDKHLSNISNNAKSLIVNMGMPSDNIIYLNFGTNYSSYIAPADGYFHWLILPSDSSPRCTAVNGYVDGGLGCMLATHNGGTPIKGFVPIRKGQTFKFNWDGGDINTTDSYLVFIYSIGSEHEAE